MTDAPFRPMNQPGQPANHVPGQPAQPGQPDSQPWSGQPGSQSWSGQQGPGQPWPGAPIPVGPTMSSPQPAPPERIGRGVALALAALPVGMILSALIWQAGFIASLSTFVMAALIPFLYRKGSGGGIRRGIPAIIALIVLGTVLSFFAMVTSDLISAYRDFGTAERASYGTFGEFWASNIAYGPVLASYGKDGAMFALFAVLGGAGTVIRLLRSSRAR